MATATSTLTTTGTRTTWQIDPGHTLIEFSAKHMMVSTVKGTFNGVAGTILLDESDFTKSDVDVTIESTTLESRAAQRDAHLRSVEFLHVEEHPAITFRSTRITSKGGDRYEVTGDLTIKGVTHEVVLDTDYEGRNTSPWGAQVIGFSATTRIKRKDFGLVWNVALESGGVLVGEEVKITLSIEAVAQAAA